MAFSSVLDLLTWATLIGDSGIGLLTAIGADIDASIDEIAGIYHRAIELACIIKQRIDTAIVGQAPREKLESLSETRLHRLQKRS